MIRPLIYTRPDKPMSLPVRRRERFDSTQALPKAEPVFLDKSTECHVTPGGVAFRMVDYLELEPDMLTLEPSAGTGNLSKALLAAGHSKYELCQVERHIKLSQGLHGFGIVINKCFLEYAAEARGKVEFPRVIMNPPFSDVRKHVAAALSLMGRGGHEESILVALVPISFSHPEAETMETLPVDTFPTAKVHTKIIRIVKDARR
jgi:hypothetical protein